MCPSDSLKKQAIGLESAPIGPNTLVVAANKNDRFRLHDDEALQVSDLDNLIHPIFHYSNFSNTDPHMQQALKLASMFLQYDTTLEFFVSPLFGRVLTADGKTYLSDPLLNAGDDKRKLLLRNVREALHCLSHSITFRFVPEKTKTFWARTLIGNTRPTHFESCTKAFQKHLSALVEVRSNYLDYYRNKNGYAASSLGDRYRHDFHFAQCLLHEMTHALGVLRRGNMQEPNIRYDHHCDPEWGYAWENFMFGGIINPQDRSVDGTHILLSKVWADPKTVRRAGGKEYNAVPVSYIAQWFQKARWNIIKRHGPLGVSAPISHLKIQCSTIYGRWIVYSDCRETKQHIKELHDTYTRKLAEDEANHKSIPPEAAFITTVKWQYATTKELQKSSVPVPTRIPKRNKLMAVAAAFYSEPSSPASSVHLEASSEMGPRLGRRKRKADSDTESSRPKKSIKPF
ncbi:hypothetical protein BS50DRAFT_599859 [Corynespora cassiicola Philippines]|uniref:Uncharacterized protein n=1 Tax=Corynespora cassiicola Philippines TaxID=1448308 RepID=A0A2T2NQU7_CORCC|nr:hypothetical protein BS50DRAFT_599859 [Corynespora cassiicola Philippines]